MSDPLRKPFGRPVRITEPQAADGRDVLVRFEDSDVCVYVGDARYAVPRSHFLAARAPPPRRTTAAPPPRPDDSMAAVWVSMDFVAVDVFAGADADAAAVGLVRDNAVLALGEEVGLLVSTVCVVFRSPVCLYARLWHIYHERL